MELDAPGIVAMDAIHVRDEVKRGDGEARLLQQLAPGAGLRRLTQALRAAGQAPLAQRRGTAAPHQQHGIPPEHGDADADEGTGRVFSGAHGTAA